MKLFRLSFLALLTAPMMAAPAVAAPVEETGPTLVARYNFDGGAVGGRVSELSGRGTALTIRSVANGAIAFPTEGANRYAAFPGPCAANAPTCAKAIMEAPDDETVTAFLLQLGSLGNIQTTTARAYSAAEMEKVLARIGG